MSPRIQRCVAAAGLAVVLVAANLTVARHEHTLDQGQAIYLELAPVDPRSIMQGDYMALAFAAGRQVPTTAPAHGRIVVKLDPRQVGVFARVHGGEALAPDERLVEYRLRKRGARIVTDAWHFQEGQARTFEGARYGMVRVRDDGVALLVGLADAKLAPLGPPAY